MAIRRKCSYLRSVLIWNDSRMLSTRKFLFYYLRVNRVVALYNARRSTRGFFLFKNHYYCFVTNKNISILN